MKTTSMLLIALLLTLAAGPALAQDETEYPPAVVEEEPLFFDVTLGPQAGVVVPLSGGVTPVVGFEATRYVSWPFYVGLAGYGGVNFGGYPELVTFGGLKGGMLIRLSGWAVEPGVMAGGAYQIVPPPTPNASAAFLPDVTFHFDLSEEFTLRTGIGYLFMPSMPQSGPIARLGMSF
jgi:hypothetical protein